MTAFHFEALTDDGKTDRGVIEADSARQARALLRARGLAPLQVEPLRGDRAEGAPRRRSRGRLRAADLALLTRQLASLLAAGLPLERALSVLIDQAERAIVREVLASVRTDVLAGSSLAAALQAHPRDFPDIYRALVAAGEQSGDLSLVMDRLASYIEDRNALTSKVLLAFTYPATVTLVALAVVIGLLTYVVPQVVSVFEQTHQKLPTLTVVLIAVSDGLRHWGWLLALLLAAAVWGARLALKRPAVRLAVDERLLRLALVGRLVRAMDAARFASTLAILVGGGVPILKALEAGAQTLGNTAMRQDVEAAIGRVREGASLARALGVGAAGPDAQTGRAQGHFPPVLIHLIASGEQTGNLPDMLRRAAQGQADELTRRTLLLTSLLEPALIVTMGVVVLVIVLAVLMPIIEINQLVR